MSVNTHSKITCTSAKLYCVLNIFFSRHLINIIKIVKTATNVGIIFNMLHYSNIATKQIKKSNGTFLSQDSDFITRNCKKKTEL